MTISPTPAAPAHDDLDALLLAFEPLPADALASEATTETSEDSQACEQPIAYRPPASAPKSATALDQRGARRARYRARTRNELLYLREIVAELQVELERWKAGRAGRLTLKPATQVKVWKALAVRQKLSRRESEAENARLRILLDNQIRFAAQLQRMVRERDARFGISQTPRVCRVDIDAADAEVLETYLAEMDAVYAQTDDALRETGVDLRAEAPHRLIRMRGSVDSDLASTSDSGSCAEFLDTHILDVDLKTARTSLWRLVMQYYLQRAGSVYKPQAEHPDAFTLKFRYPTTWFGRESFITVTHSLRTYDEPNRQVNVYRVLSVGEGALAGMATDETGWSVLTPSANDPSRTVNRCVTRLTAMRYHSLESHKPEEAPPQLLEFAKILFEYGDEDMGKMISHLQDMSLKCSL